MPINNSECNPLQAARRRLDDFQAARRPEPDPRRIADMVSHSEDWKTISTNEAGGVETRYTLGFRRGGQSHD